MLRLLLWAIKDEWKKEDIRSVIRTGYNLEDVVFDPNVIVPNTFLFEHLSGTIMYGIEDLLPSIQLKTILNNRIIDFYIFCRIVNTHMWLSIFKLLFLTIHPKVA